MQIVQKTNGRSMKRVLLSSALLLVSTLTFAQSKVSGTVKDANGEPLIGVSVMEVGTNNGAVTDINGKYLECEARSEAEALLHWIYVKDH